MQLKLLSRLQTHPYSTLTLLAVLSRILSLSFLLLTQLSLSSFDTSSSLLLSPPTSLHLPSPHSANEGKPAVLWGSKGHLKESRLTPLLRWDTLYFSQIAVRGYRYEQEAAFMPGVPCVMRWSGWGIQWSRRRLRWGEGAEELTTDDVVLGGAVVTMLVGVAATLLLFRLTTLLFPSTISYPSTFALLSTLLFLLPPSPSTLLSLSPYTEPYTAFFSFLGMSLLYHRSRSSPHSPPRWWAKVAAAGVWGLGGLVRAQGIVLGVGFFAWEGLWREPMLMREKAGDGVKGKRNGFGWKTFFFNLPEVLILSAISVAPWLAFQLWVKKELCPISNGGVGRPWCDSMMGLGLSYGWIQSKYWDVGFLRYWTLQQVPNFVLAAPVLLLSLAASGSYYKENWIVVLERTVPWYDWGFGVKEQVEVQLTEEVEEEQDGRGLRKRTMTTSLGKKKALVMPSEMEASDAATTTDPGPEYPFFSPTIIPFIHLHTFLTLLLLFSSHTQIILRVCATDPVTFWYGAHLLQVDAERAGRSGDWKWGRVWVGYCVVWGGVSLVLWSAFMPPA